MASPVLPAGYGRWLIACVRENAGAERYVTTGAVIGSNPAWPDGGENLINGLNAALVSWLRPQDTALGGTFWFTDPGGNLVVNGWSIIAPGSHVTSSPPAPNNMAAIITKRTALAGRKFRGRHYVPLMQMEDFGTAGTAELSESGFARLQTFAALLMDEQQNVFGNNAAGAQLLHGVGEVVPLGLPSPITTLEPRIIAGTLRSRINRRYSL